jgi:hypothetical protein
MGGTVDQLIAILLDPAASVSDRDDAAMDLGEHDDALGALIQIGSDPNQHPVVLASCGGAIAQIWRRLAVSTR